MNHIWLKLLLLLLILAPAAGAQSLSGTLLDGSGNRVAGARVTVCSPNSSGNAPCSPKVAGSTTASDGSWFISVAAGTYDISFDRTGLIATKLLNVTTNNGTTVICPAVCTASSLSVVSPTCANGAFQNVPFSCQITPTGGLPPYNYSLVSGGGGGLSMSVGSGAGLITGTPPGTSAITFNVTVTDTNNTSQSVVITVTPGSLTSIAVTPLNTTVQVNSTQQMSALGTFSNGTNDLSKLATWSCSGTCGTVSSTGLFTAGSSNGTATIKATFNGVTDDGGVGIPVTVTGSAPPFFVTPTLTTGQIYQAYIPTVQLACTGGTPPYTFTLGSLSLQSGLSLSTSGKITGLPTVSGTNSGTFTCTDTNSNVGTSPSASLTVASISSIAITFLPASPITATATTQATATGTYSSGPNNIIPNNFLTWTSSNTTCATVNGTGLVTALNVSSTCTSSIQAAAGVVNGSTTLTVNPIATASATFVQLSINDNCSSASTTCAVTFTQNTAAGTALVAFGNNLGGGSMSSFTDGGDTFSACSTSCNGSQAGARSVDIKYNLSGAGGKSSGTCTVSAAPGFAWTCGMYEFSTNNANGFSFDASGNVVNNSSATTAPGVALTLTGSNDVIVQIADTSHQTSSISSGYTLNIDGHHNAEAYSLNTSSGTAPTFTWNSSSISVAGAIALNQTGSSSGGGGGIPAASCSAIDVQAAINSAPSGATVVLPTNSTCSWSAAQPVTLSAAKPMTLNGQGSTINFSDNNTNPGSSSVGAFYINAGTTASTFVTGFTFNGGYLNGNCPIQINTAFSPLTMTFRFHHNTINMNSGSGPLVSMCIHGNGPGLVDHNTMSTTIGFSDFTQNWGEGNPGPATSWFEDVVPGSATMLFFEDNTITGPANNSNSGTGLSQNFGGVKVVYRHNIFVNTALDFHGYNVQVQPPTVPNSCDYTDGTGTTPHTRWWEVYNNNFTVTGTTTNIFAWMDVRAGSGVIFNNTASGPNVGSGVINLRSDCSDTSGFAYPAQDQVGRGRSNASGSLTTNASPAYLWNNTNMPLSCTFGCSYVQSGRDFFNSASQPATITRCQSFADVTAGCPITYNYVPFVYPHPLSTP